MTNIAVMSVKEQKHENRAGKKSERKRRMPGEVDRSNLEYLGYRDLTRVAEEMGVTPDYVSKVRHGRCQSVRVLAALLKKGGENRRLLTDAAVH
jgi:hypothetical protein